MSAKQTLRQIPTDRLVSHDRNRLVNEERVAEMAASMREHGLLTPLVVTEHLTDYNRWLILDGHHRAAAARKLGLSQVLCTIRHGLDEDADKQLLLMVVANCQRQDMTPMDRSEWFGLLRRSMPVSEIARRTGLTEGRIYDSLSLLDLDVETRQRVRAGDVKVGEAARAVKQVRAAARTGTAIGHTPRKTVTVEAPHFTPKHPLAADVRAACDHATRPKVGQVGCGQCWEQTIRNDALGGAA